MDVLWICPDKMHWPRMWSSSGSDFDVFCLHNGEGYRAATELPGHHEMLQIPASGTESCMFSLDDNSWHAFIYINEWLYGLIPETGCDF